MHDNIEGCNQLLTASVLGERHIQPARRFLEVYGIWHIALEKRLCDSVKVTVRLDDGCVVPMHSERVGEETVFETSVSA